MSTLMYAQIAQVTAEAKQTAARDAQMLADAEASGNSEEIADAKARSDADAESQPTIGRYVEALAGMIPAEVLALHALILSATTKIENPATNAIIRATTTTIPQATTLKMAFWGLVLLSLLLYVVPRGHALWKDPKRPRNAWTWFRNIPAIEAVRAAIPPLSFIGWTMLQRATAFDAAFPDVAEANRTVAGLFLAVMLLAVSTWVAFKPNTGTPPSPPTP